MKKMSYLKILGSIHGNLEQATSCKLRDLWSSYLPFKLYYLFSVLQIMFI